MGHIAGKLVDIQVIEAMRPYFNKFFSNPSSLHSFVREVREELQKAPEKVAQLIGAKSEEIFFMYAVESGVNSIWVILTINVMHAKDIFPF